MFWPFRKQRARSYLTSVSPADFMVGSVAVLKSGGRLMTLGVQCESSGRWLCEWLDASGEHHAELFDQRMLKVLLAQQ